MVAGMSHASMCVSNSGTATSSTGSPTRATPGTSTAACMRARTPQRSTRRVSRRPRGGGAEGTSPGVQKSRTGTQIQDSNTHTGVQESRSPGLQDSNANTGQQYTYRSPGVQDFRTAIQIQDSNTNTEVQESRASGVQTWRYRAAPQRRRQDRGVHARLGPRLCTLPLPGVHESRTSGVQDSKGP